MKKIILILALLLSQSCFAEPESMTVIYNEYERNKFIKILKEKNIPHTITNINQIFYPKSYSADIIKAKESIFGPIDISRKGASVNKENAPKVGSELIKNDISYKVVVTKDMAVFSWLSSIHDEAIQIVDDALK